MEALDIDALTDTPRDADARARRLAHVSRVFYPDYDPDHWERRVERLVGERDRVLEIGAGSGEGHQYRVMLAGRPGGSLGIDLDPRVLDNPNFDETAVLSAYDLDAATHGTFDVVLSNYVAEHIDDPLRFLERQVALMNDGGRGVHHTVSRFYYASLVNVMVPEGVKHWLIRHLGSGRLSEDVFPAHYLLNDAGALRRLADATGCDIAVERYRVSPGYLRRSTVLMVLYSLVDIPLSALFPALKAGLVFTVTKRAPAHSDPNPR